VASLDRVGVEVVLHHDAHLVNAVEPVAQAAGRAEVDDLRRP